MTLKQIIQSSTPEKCLSRLLFHRSRPSIKEPFCMKCHRVKAIGYTLCNYIIYVFGSRHDNQKLKFEKAVLLTMEVCMLHN